MTQAAGGLLDARAGAPARLGGRSQEGFSLTELLAVLAVMALLMGTALGVLEQSLRSWRVLEAAHSLGSALRAARTRAIFERAEAVVPFDPPRRRYALAGRGAAAGVMRQNVGGVWVRLVKLPPGVTFARPDHGSDTVTLVRPATTDSVAVFDRKGMLVSSSRPGYAYLGDPRREAYARVGVNIVGTVMVEQWTGNEWK